MNRGNDLLCYTHTLSSNILGILLALLYLQYNQKFDSMILKMWVKGKFVLWQPRYYNLKKIHIFEVLFFFFRKRTVTDKLKNFSSNTFFKWYTLENIYFVKLNYFNYFSRISNKVKEKFWNIFDWPLCRWHWK